MAAILHFEGAGPIDADLYALDVFYQAGLRSLGPVWSPPKPFLPKACRFASRTRPTPARA